jgi:hypothetical protein
MFGHVAAGQCSDQISTIEAGARVLGDHRVIAHQQNAVGNFQDFIDVCANHQRRSALGAVAQQLADVAAGAHVDALKGFIEDQHPPFAEQPAAEHDFLLIAA